MRELPILALLLAAQMSSAAPKVPLEKDVEPPSILSETGLFPGDGVIPFEIIQSLWVDHAQKQRFIYIPETAKVSFSPTEPYGFPVGTIFVKHFQMETSRGVFQDLETRLLIRKVGENQQNWEGYTYQWNGDEAFLVPDKVSPKIELRVDPSAPGGAREQTFSVPSRQQCLQCHNPSVGYIRGFETQQLNRLVGGVNQLAVLNKAGLFDHDIGEPEQYSKYVAIDNFMVPLEARARSYLAVNCAHCHNPEPEAMCAFVGIDLRYSSFNPKALLDSGHLKKGASAESELFLRMDSVEPFYRMPFIGSVIRDESALKVISRWIDEL